MEIKTTTTELSSVMKTARKCLGTIGVSNCFLLETNERQAWLTASNGTDHLSMRLNTIEDPDPVSVCIPPQKLIDILKTVGHTAPLTLRIEEDICTVIINNGRYKIKCSQDVELFPRPAFKCERTVILPSPKTALSLTAPFAAIAPTYPVLGAIRIRASRNEVSYVGSDSNFLARYIVQTDNNARLGEEVFTANLPAHAVSVLGDIVSDESMEMEVSENGYRFATESVRYMVAKINGNYPDADRLIPTELPNGYTVNVADLAESMRMASVGGNVSSCYTSLSVYDNNLYMESVDEPMNAKVSVKTRVDDNGGPLHSPCVGISWKRMLKILSVMPAKTARLILNDGNKPLYLCPAQQTPGVDYVILLMPMRQ